MFAKSKNRNEIKMKLFVGIITSFLLINIASVTMTTIETNALEPGSEIKLNTSGKKVLDAPSIVPSSDDTIYAVWSEATTGENSQIVFAKVADSNSTTDIKRKVISTSDQSHAPAISVYGDNIYVTWYSGEEDNTDIFYRKSGDGGNSFGSVVNLSNNPQSTSLNPHIASNGKNVYIVWQDDDAPSNFDIFYKKSSNDGNSFGSVVNLSQDEAGSSNPRVAAEGNNVYVAWDNNTPSKTDISFKKSSNGGNSFEKSKNLSNNKGLSLHPDISVDKTNVIVSWEDNSMGQYDIIAKESNDNGNNFGSEINISKDKQNSFHPSTDIQGNKTNVAWQGVSSGKSNVIIAQSSDNGKSFDQKTEIKDSDKSGNPNIVSTNKSTYIVWRDGTPGEADSKMSKK